jgi:glycosyltransferase involved in cell wall biosynthesis
MGRVGQELLLHLIQRPHYQTLFHPWANDYMDGYWEPEIEKVVVRDPTAHAVDQWITFCSVVDSALKGHGKRQTPWFFYELSTLPPDIVTDLNAKDHIYLTSSFVLEVFKDQGVKVPMSVLGHGYDPGVYRFRQRSKDGIFTFLAVAEHTPRKNLPALIRCFQAAFAATDKVRLVLKLGLHGEGDLAQFIERPEQVQLRAECFDEETELADLYYDANCFVLPTRAEGFGMPMLEAMATGLPVITTNYGGHLDFCSEQNAYLIENSGLVESDPECFPYIESYWADPSEEHLIHLLREVYENYDLALEKGRRGADLIAADWTWDKQLARAFP